MRFYIKTSRWPWQESSKNLGSPLNHRGARFGGGWSYKLGISIGLGNGVTIMLELLFGIVTIHWGGK